MALRPIRGGAANPSRPSVGVQPVYEDFRPMSDWQQDEESKILHIFLPGFMKEHLRVSTEGQNIVRVRGQRLVAGNKWSRFQEDYQVPENCNIRAVRARFEEGILTITMPWKKESQVQDRSKEAAKEIPPTPPPSPVIQKRKESPQKPPTEKRPQKGADDIPPKTTSPADIQKLPPSPPKPTVEPSRQKGADDKSAKIISTPDTQKREMSPQKVPKESGPQKGADDIPPKVLTPLTVEPSRQKGADDISTKIISTPDTQKREMSPQKVPKESGPQKGADDIPPKVLTPPTLTAEKGNHEKIFSQPQTQIGQGEQRVGTRSHEPKTATGVTSDKKGVERKEISTDTKLKEGTDDKKSIEKSKAAVPDPDKNVVSISVPKKKRKSKKIQGGSEFIGQSKRQTEVASSSIDSGLENRKKAAKSLAELNEERQLLMNIGAAVLVIVALGTYISYTVGSGKV